MKHQVEIIRLETGKIVIKPNNEIEFKNNLSRLVGKKCDIEIKIHRKLMSLPQLAYWWAVPVAILADHCGYDRDEMHVALKYKFLRTVDANGLEVVPSIRDLNTDQMTKLIDDVIRWAQVDLGVDIPAPNEVPIPEFELN